MSKFYPGTAEDRRLKLPCPACKKDIPMEKLDGGFDGNCPFCRGKLDMEIFPAFFRSRSSSKNTEILDDREAGCFYHPEKKAVVACDGCGRFLCSLCDISLEGKRMCPRCIETGKRKGRIKNLGTTHLRHDDIALSIAVLPIITVWGTLISAPIALIYSIVNWNKPRGFLEHSRIKLVMAIAVSLLIIGGWTVGLITLIASF